MGAAFTSFFLLTVYLFLSVGDRRYLADVEGEVHGLGELVEGAFDGRACLCLTTDDFVYRRAKSVSLLGNYERIRRKMCQTLRRSS